MGRIVVHLFVLYTLFLCFCLFFVVRNASNATFIRATNYRKCHLLEYLPSNALTLGKHWLKSSTLSAVSLPRLLSFHWIPKLLQSLSQSSISSTSANTLSDLVTFTLHFRMAAI